MGSEYGLKISSDLAASYLRRGVRLLKMGKLRQSEVLFLKAQQAMESVEIYREGQELEDIGKDSEKLKGISERRREDGGGKEWQVLRLGVLRNLARIYRKLDDWKKGYWVLKDLAKEVKVELFIEDPNFCLKGVDSFY